MNYTINNIRKKYIKSQGKKKNTAIKIINTLLDTKYNYHFNWFGIPTIQFPNDLMVIQEIIYEYKPDIIVETGVAHGGTLLFYASILKLIKKKFSIIGIDILIKKKNKKKILSNQLSKNIKLFETSSDDLDTIQKIKKIVNKKKVIIILDSNHSHNHVLNELNLYSEIIKKNGYLIAMDTTTEFVKKKHINRNRNFSKGNNPFTAVNEFLKKNKNFKIDFYYENKSFITGCFNGFLKKIK